MKNKTQFKEMLSVFDGYLIPPRLFRYDQALKEFLFANSGETLNPEEVEHLLNSLSAGLESIVKDVNKDREVRKKGEEAKARAASLNASILLSSSSVNKLRKTAKKHGLSVPKLLEMLDKEELFLTSAESERQKQKISDNLFTHQRNEVIELREKLNKACQEVLNLTSTLNEERNHNVMLYTQIIKQVQGEDI